MIWQGSPTDENGPNMYLVVSNGCLHHHVLDGRNYSNNWLFLLRPFLNPGMQAKYYRQKGRGWKHDDQSVMMVTPYICHYNPGAVFFQSYHSPAIPECSYVNTIHRPQCAPGYRLHINVDTKSTLYFPFEAPQTDVQRSGRGGGQVKVDWIGSVGV